jgi:hypothetical protein
MSLGGDTMSWHYRNTSALLDRLLLSAYLTLLCPLLHAMQVDLAVTVQGDLQPAILGSCNLPDGMKLRVRVTRKESSFESETAVEVQSGKFKVGPLLQSNANLNPGSYNFEIVSMVAAEQPEPVRAVVGQNGAELRGPLTKRDSVGTRVRLVGSFDVGRGANAELDRARREQVELSNTRWWRKNCSDICSGSERYALLNSKAFDRPACFKTCVANPPVIRRRGEP